MGLVTLEASWGVGRSGLRKTGLAYRTMVRFCMQVFAFQKAIEVRGEELALYMSLLLRF